MAGDSKINPHDAFFKGNFEDRDVVISYIETFTPSRISELIDKDSLRLDRTEYVDKKLKKYFSDVVYTCNFKGKEIKLTLLFEHKSYDGSDIYFQLLRYIVQIWERQISSKNGKRTPVLPIVFYNGESGWKSKSFFDYFEHMPDELKVYSPAFEFILTDLNSCSDEFLESAVKSHRLKAVTLLMKHIKEDEYLTSRFREILAVVSKAEGSAIGRFLELFLNYLLEASELDADVIDENRDILLSLGGDEIMTLAEKIKQKGIDEGIEKGILNSREVLVKFIQNKFGSDVYESDILKIENCRNIDKLKDALEAILQAEKKSEVLDKLR